jgi:hypothetical protein
MRFRPVRPVPSAWHEMPGHAATEPRRPVRAVLSKNPPFEGCYTWDPAPRGMVDSSLPGGRRGLRSDVDTNTNPGTSSACNRTVRWNGEGKNWPYRPKGTVGLVSRDFIPGWKNWPYRPESHSQSTPPGPLKHWEFLTRCMAPLRPLRCMALLRLHPSRFRPVRPAPSAWHEMPGHTAPEPRRPVRAVLSKNPPCEGCYA